MDGRFGSCQVVKRIDKEGTGSFLLSRGGMRSYNSAPARSGMPSGSGTAALMKAIPVKVNWSRSASLGSLDASIQW